MAVWLGAPSRVWLRSFGYTAHVFHPYRLGDRGVQSEQPQRKATHTQNMRHIHIPFVAVPLALLLLAACGFQLRGGWQLPPALGNTALQGGDYPLYSALKEGFRAAGADLHRGEGNAARLRITQEQLGRRTLAVDANGKAIKFGVYYALRFDARSADGKQLLAPQNINLLRDYLYTGDDVHGAARQEALLRAEMYADMAGQILQRLAALNTTPR